MYIFYIIIQCTLFNAQTLIRRCRKQWKKINVKKKRTKLFFLSTNFFLRSFIRSILLKKKNFFFLFRFLYLLIHILFCSKILYDDEKNTSNYFSFCINERDIGLDGGMVWSFGVTCVPVEAKNLLKVDQSDVKNDSWANFEVSLKKKENSDFVCEKFPKNFLSKGVGMKFMGKFSSFSLGSVAKFQFYQKDEGQKGIFFFFLGSLFQFPLKTSHLKQLLKALG